MGHPLGDIKVRSTMEAVSSDSIFSVLHIGQSIDIGVSGHGLMEGGIEDRHLRNPGKEFLTGCDSSQIVRIM